MRMKLRSINTSVNVDQQPDAKTHTLSFTAVVVDGNMGMAMSQSSLTLSLTAAEAQDYVLGKDYFVTANLAPALPLTSEPPISGEMLG